MGQPPRKWLKPRKFFNTPARETIRAKFVALKADHGGWGNPWLADRIMDDLWKRSPKEAKPLNPESFRKHVHRFMQGRIRMGDDFVALIAPFADALPYSPAPEKIQMRVELAINDRAEAIIFHSFEFPHELSWLEFDADTAILTFVMKEGAYRDMAILVREELRGYVKRAFEVLMVLMDESNGEPIEGGYIPLRVYAQSPIEGQASTAP